MLSEYENLSAFSASRAECRHHLIFGTGLRRLAEEDGLWIPLTNNEHNMSPDPTMRIHGNPVAEKLSKMCGQLAWEMQAVAQGASEIDARDAFRRRYGISYL
ncbi:MAG: hypothetical protein K6E34_03410 [Lachnospiraceae bacterium]|nr:hypothetical protein [Lachnospiraceae bacterium]